MATKSSSLTRNGITYTTTNPIIGTIPSETIDNALGALTWLQAMDAVAVEAFGGEPADTIQNGRRLLGMCCFEALRAAADELDGKAVQS